jgi:hypothetical protein
MRIILLLLLILSGCRTVPVRSDCTDIPCRAEEHNPSYWRQP